MRRERFWGHVNGGVIVSEHAEVDAQDEGLRFLLVDDDTVFLSSLKLIVESLGHEAECARNAEQAASLVERNTYDVVLVDYLMPGKNGTWFMKNVTAPRMSKFLLMTAHEDMTIINDMFRLGVCGYLIKPFSRDDLARHIEFHVNRKQQERNVRAAKTE